jgi:ATP-dependent Clp protease ATP-binding subunit ClpC
VFERYTERARRIVFFSRYDAAMLGSRQIEPAHLLLGILRGAKDLAALIGDDERVEQLVRSIKRPYTEAKEKISPRVDLPMSYEFERVLAFAEEEAELLKQFAIVPGHLLLGLLRLDMPPADALAAYGVTLEAVPQHALQHTH